MRAREIQLLEILIDSIGRRLTKEDEAGRLYTFEEAPSMNAVEQLVARLRRKLEGTPLTIKTARGLGYMAYLSDEH